MAGWKHGGSGHCNNVQLGRFGRNRSNVWRYPGVNSFARCGEEGNLLALHPDGKAGGDDRRRNPRLLGPR